MQLHRYQQEARDFLLRRLHRHSGAGLWLEPGLGKTITTLDTIMSMREFGEVGKVLVVAPARVIATSWPKEIKNWGLPLTWGWLQGSDQERQAVVDSDPDIYFVGCENLAYRHLSEETLARRKSSQMSEWLLRNGFKVDMVVIDEVTKFKNWSASRSKVLRRLLKRIPKRITLTGTPTPNGLGDIFAQQYILDSGETLTPYIGRFRDRFMRSCGFEGRQWEMRPEMVAPLQEMLAPWYMAGTALEHLDMPELVQNEIEVELPTKAAKIYKDMQRLMFAEIDEQGITALTGSSKYSLCRQIASGNAYDDHGGTVAVHNAKLDALEDLFEELNGKPLIVAYWFDHEYKRIIERFPQAEVIRGGTRVSQTVDIINRWQRGQLKMIVAQAGALSHGVDGLQKAGNDLCWYTLTDQPEIKQQLERRVYRQGVVGNQVRIHYLLAKSTLDRTVYTALNVKEASQRDIVHAIQRMAA